ncbi:MAG: hypothetical protein Q9174_006507 [Haloplaca sp. 1 TL-2023]
MSRATQRNGQTGGAVGGDDEICPVCPAPCPVAGCARTLRKQRFRKQTFEDLRIEKEVDVRRKVAAVFNKQEEDFETLRAYNNYLEDMEVVTFNLLEGIDVAATQRKLDAYAAQNAQQISQRDARTNRDRNNQAAQQAAQKEQAMLSRSAADGASIASIAERGERHRETMDALASAQLDTSTGGQKVVLKKSTARRTAAEKARDKQRQQQQQMNPSTQQEVPVDISDNPVYRIEGLRQVVAAPEEAPYDPFAGLSLMPSYYTLQTHYDNPWLDKARTEPSILAGGYSLREYYQRTMLEASAGLGCFLQDEIREREHRSDGDGMVATEGAAMAAGGDEGEDVL